MLQRTPHGSDEQPRPKLILVEPDPDSNRIWRRLSRADRNTILVIAIVYGGFGLAWLVYKFATSTFAVIG